MQCVIWKRAKKGEQKAVEYFEKAADLGNMDSIYYEISNCLANSVHIIFYHFVMRYACKKSKHILTKKAQHVIIKIKQWKGWKNA